MAMTSVQIAREALKIQGFSKYGCDLKDVIESEGYDELDSDWFEPVPLNQNTVKMKQTKRFSCGGANRTNRVSLKDGKEFIIYEKKKATLDSNDTSQQCVSEETYAMKKKLISNECNLDEKSVVEAIEEKKISAEYATSYTGVAGTKIACKSGYEPKDPKQATADGESFVIPSNYRGIPKCVKKTTTSTVNTNTNTTTPTVFDTKTNPSMIDDGDDEGVTSGARIAARVRLALFIPWVFFLYYVA